MAANPTKNAMNIEARVFDGFCRTYGLRVDFAGEPNRPGFNVYQISNGQHIGWFRPYLSGGVDFRTIDGNEGSVPDVPSAFKMLVERVKWQTLDPPVEGM